MVLDYMNTQARTLEYIPCNLCNSNEATSICSYEDDINIVKCDNCGLIYRNPRLSSDINREIESLERYGDYETLEEQISKSREKSFNNVLITLEKRIKNQPKRLLDLGCGQGHFLNRAQGFGWQVQGIEVAKSACEYAKEKFGIEVSNRELEEVHFLADHFDAVTLWNVLDHLLNPLGVLNEIYRILKPGGVLVIRVPNASFHLCLHKLFSFVSSYLERRNLPDPSVIVNYGFTKATIKKVLERARYHNIEICNSPVSYGDPYGLFKTSQKLIAKLKDVVYLTSELVFYISGKRYIIGSSILVYAQK